MLRRHTFTIPGKPKSKGRPRFGRGGHTYTDKATKDAEKVVHDSYLESEGPVFSTPVQLTMTFFADKTEVTITEIEQGKSSVRADLDNLIKLVMDGLHGAAYENDNIVYQINGIKTYKIEK